MKVRIFDDEWYPVFTLRDFKEDNPFVDVDEDTLRRWEASFETFRKCQREMAELTGLWCKDDLP